MTASRQAFDGDYNRNMEVDDVSRTCYHSQYAATTIQYIEVDLGQMFNISFVILYNRQSYSSIVQRLRYVKIVVIDENGASVMCNNFTEPPNYVAPKLDCVAEGRHVRIGFYKKWSSYLQLCEVEVYSNGWLNNV